jgi:endonuclease/exonuclease/phosphatase (EEP) superfamily protein YafD
MLSLRWIGEKNLTLAFLLYLPRNAFLIPSALLLLPAVLFHRWAAVALLISSIFFLLVGMDFGPRIDSAPSPSEAGKSLTVLTYNRGQHGNLSLQPFKNLTRPDLITLQDAPGRASGYLNSEGYEEFPHALDSAEFTLLSRYPILGAEPILISGEDSPPIAARFTIDFEGRKIAVYSVHTVSPRDVLLYYRRGAFLYGILGMPGTPLAQKRRSNQEYWDRRIEEARILRDRIAEDPLPVIIAGDFNAPAGGYIHGFFRSRFQDAHAKAGRGFGNTFPGTTRNPLSLGGPWMRIDYLFCDEAWEPVWCITEADRPSQHRAVAAKFELQP